MRKIFCIVISLCVFSNISEAQSKFTETVEQDDTLYSYTLPTAYCMANRKFANDTVRYHFNQLRKNIRTVFPYVKEAGRVVNEVNNILPTLKRKERKKFLEQKEIELRQKFEEPLKNLYDTQGKLLILLINRETGNSVYKVLKEIKNPIRASLYEITALANGLNLSEKWDVRKYKDEDLIMQVMERQYGYTSPK